MSADWPPRSRPQRREAEPSSTAASIRFWFFSLLILGLILTVAGRMLSQQNLVPIQMNYGNFDIPGKIAFVNRMLPGIFDHCSLKQYNFEEIHWHPFLFLFGGLFPFMLFWGLYKNREYWRDRIYRVWVQWLSFVIARLGVFRASQMWPIRRSCLGTFPFLNCQACEMTTGACPIGLLQNLIIRGYWPIYLVGSMILFGVTLGKSICGWLCPFGFVSDLIDRIGVRLVAIPRQLANVRYLVLFLVIFASLLYVHLGIYNQNFFCSTICVSGKILGIAPYYLTSGFESFVPFSNWTDDLGGRGFLVAFQVSLTLIAVVAMLLISGRLFCRVLCPLGGFWGLFNGVALVGVKHKAGNCTTCGACEAVCPMGVTAAFQDFIDTTSCMSCGRCVSACKSGARFFRWGLPSITAGKPARRHERAVLKENIPSDFTVVIERKGKGEQEKVPNMKSGKGFQIDPLSFGYGTFYNRIRRDFYMVAMTLLAKSPIDMARYAFDQTDFYRKLYRREPEVFEDLPLALKKDLGSCDPYDVLSQEWAGQVALYGETTGSSGYPTPAFYTEREFHAGRVFSKITPYVGLLQEALAQNRAVINGLTFGFTIAGMTFGDFLQAQGGMVANVGTRSTIATPERMVRALTRVRPSILTGTPVDLLSWMKILREDYPNKADEVIGEIQGFISTAELCSVSRSRRLEEEFGLKHVDVYACVEGFFAIPCPCGEKHILPVYYTELFDDSLKCLGSYGDGRFAFTNLAKNSSPLVRYLLDDFVTITQSTCKFGFKRSVEPHGRYELTVCLGGKRYGVRHFEEAIFRHGLFGDYRIVLEDIDLMKVTLEEYGRHDSRETIEESLAAKFGLKTTVDLVPFGTITKYREIRVSKPILKLEDRRSVSTQKVPEYL